MNLDDIREEYDTGGLDADAIGPEPVAAIERWLQDAVDAGVQQPNAMAIATVNLDGRPSLRTVLLKQIDEGLVFYTNTLSRKGRELSQRPFIAASLTWVALHRQVRVEGAASLVESEEADRYFESRPFGARIAAAASPQSEVIADRAWLERRVAAVAAEHTDEPPPRPDHWSGYRIIPTVVEFWQGRRDRLHDRIAFHLGPDGWTSQRLAP